MTNTLEQRLVKARNELKAQKVAMELAYSSILWPENAATASWSGNVSLTLADEGIVARFRVRFARTDGKAGAPMVDFAIGVSFSPTYEEYTSSVERTWSGNDLGYVDNQNYTGYTAEAGEGYVDYYIDFIRDLMANYNTLSTIAITIEAEAISIVEGNLTITRLI